MSSFALKIIAIVCMTLDHFDKIIGQSGLLQLYPDPEVALASMEALSLTSGILFPMEVLGRAAFPLFAFMMAEGCAKTHSMPRYLGRLALFAVISEPFFYFAFEPGASFTGLMNDLVGLNFTNVFFTLFLAALGIFIFQKLSGKCEAKGAVMSLIAALVLALAAEYFNTDYGAMGVLLIVALYLTRGRRGIQCVVVALWAVTLYLGGYLLTFGSGGVANSVLEALGACLACIPIARYNGKRGRAMKWTFYVYYPAHLLVLTLIDRALLG